MSDEGGPGVAVTGCRQQVVVDVLCAELIEASVTERGYEMLIDLASVVVQGGAGSQARRRGRVEPALEELAEGP